MIDKKRALFALFILWIIALGSCRTEDLTTRELELAGGEVSTYARITGVAGADSALIAINGGPGLSSHYMASLEQLAGGDLSVVTYDQRGTGRSSRPPDAVTNYELVDYSADLDALRQELGFEQVYLFGHSWGGIVAMHYATAYPERVQSLVLAGSGPPTRSAIEAGQLSFTDRVHELQAEGLIPRPLPRDGTEQLEAILPAYFADPGFSFTPGEAERIENDDVTNRLSWMALGDYDLTAEVGRLSMPVLILWGEEDPFGLPMAEATRDALKGTEVIYTVLEQCGHFWQECEVEFLEHVAAFIE